MTAPVSILIVANLHCLVAAVGECSCALFNLYIFKCVARKRLLLSGIWACAHLLTGGSSPSRVDEDGEERKSDETKLHLVAL
jgi:hypothetical protein